MGRNYTPHPDMVEAKRIRAETMGKIRKLLAEQPLSTGGIAKALGVSGDKNSTCYDYLKSMARSMHIRRNGLRDANGREMWELVPEGERTEPAKRPTGHVPKEHIGTAPRRVFAKARQIGMQRDDWAMAFFGPPVAP